MNRARITLLVSALLLAACGEQLPPTEKLTQDDYRLRHPLGVTPAVAQLRLASANAALSSDDRRRLHEFALQFVRKGHGVISVSAGGSGRDDRAAQTYAATIATDLVDEGVKPDELSLWLVVDDPLTAPGQAALSFATAITDLPECGDWSDEGGGRVSASNFGCAFQHNLGAMVADPRDLERRRMLGAADGTRGDIAMERYRNGDGSWSFPIPRTYFNPNDATKSKSQ